MTMPPNNDTSVGGRRLTKNEKRRLKKKAESFNNQENKSNSDSNSSKPSSHIIHEDSVNHVEDLNVIVEYVSADLDTMVEDDPTLAQFKEIFQKFSTTGNITVGEDSDNKKTLEVEDTSDKDKQLQISLEESKVIKPLSKKKKKMLSRLSVAELKQLVQRPDVVEAHDVTAADPRLLVYIKAYRNTVPVPRHWCHKRKYLQGKRGVEKPPFKLPDYIADTGIAKIREAVLESELLKKSKQKARDKMTPKMGKIDIDYQVLHDAFFKYQTKPKLSKHGDLYYEGKEFEVDHKEKKPGVLSSELKAALGMTDTAPPPWLINMQRNGPPPSYPSMRIPGLSAPIPDGASYGYHVGGWGKPPVDEYNRPLYGDVFATSVSGTGSEFATVDRSHWGELEEASSEEEEEESEAEEEDDEEDGGRYRGEGRGAGDMSGIETPLTLDGISSVASGLETPDTINLRKRTGVETPLDNYGGATPELYHIIKEQTSKDQARGQFYGSEKTYILPGSGVDMTINPDELESEISGLKGQDALRDAYDNQLAAGRSDQDASGKDYDDDSNDPRNKRKRRAESSAVSSRHKNFKF